MNPEVKEQWITALESGQYHQGAGQLHQAGGDFGTDQFCCLGVLCDLAFKAGIVTRELRYDEYRYGFNGMVSFLPDEVVEWAGLTPNTEAVNIKIADEEGKMVASNLVSLNDSGASFEKIAEYIRHGL